MRDLRQESRCELGGGILLKVRWCLTATIARCCRLLKILGERLSSWSRIESIHGAKWYLVSAWVGKKMVKNERVGRARGLRIRRSSGVRVSHDERMKRVTVEGIAIVERELKKNRMSIGAKARLFIVAAIVVEVACGGTYDATPQRSKADSRCWSRLRHQDYQLKKSPSRVRAGWTLRFLIGLSRARGSKRRSFGRGESVGRIGWATTQI